MREHFFSRPVTDVEPECTAFTHAWRPAGARPLSAALTEAHPLRDPPTRPAWPTFELR